MKQLLRLGRLEKSKLRSLFQTRKDYLSSCLSGPFSNCTCSHSSRTIATETLTPSSSKSHGLPAVSSERGKLLAFTDLSLLLVKSRLGSMMPVGCRL